MKKSRKIKMFVVLCSIFLICSFMTQVFASDPTSKLFESGTLKNVSSGVQDGGSSGIMGAINTVIGLIQLIGTGVSLIMVSILGIKYLLASVEEKAEIKKMAIPVVIGAVLLFGAVNIIAVVEEFSHNVIND